MPTYKGRWTARIEQDFEIEADSPQHFESLIEQEMNIYHASEGMDYEYEVEDIEDDNDLDS